MKENKIFPQILVKNLLYLAPSNEKNIISITIVEYSIISSNKNGKAIKEIFFRIEY